MDYDMLLEPFWETGRMLYEPVMLYQIQKETPFGYLRYTPQKIISIKNSALNKEYIENVDYKITGKQIKMLKDSKMPFITDDIYWARQTGEDLATQLAADKIGRVLYSDTPYITEHQIVVTYEFDVSECRIKAAQYDETKLQCTINRLLKKEPLRMVLFGDSITFGANASKLMNIEPFLPTWGDLLKIKLEKHYNTCIELINTAVSGMNSTWGRENAQEQVCKYTPDLTVIAFGMNDGSQKLLPQDFKSNILDIINQVGTGDFILIAPMLANPDSEFVGFQEEYFEVLKQLETHNIIAVDMAGIHKELLAGKKYIDFTGNNINHPNDFLIRCYAINILNVLIKGREVNYEGK